jgi:hypothetical protein
MIINIIITSLFLLSPLITIIIENYVYINYYNSFHNNIYYYKLNYIFYY